MEEVVTIRLDNEMDLILAHKRTMKLSELCGLSLSAQTTFATAVSEIARCSIGNGKDSSLVLGISTLRANKKEITASIFDSIDLTTINADSLSYASRLIGNLETLKTGNRYEIRLHLRINFGGTISKTKVDSFKDYFKNEPPLSPYDEIRKKNIQLIDLANKLQESEEQYRLLTDTLPLMMLSLNPKGELEYANKWLKDFLSNHTAIPNFPWPAIIHKDDFKNVNQEWSKSQQNKTIFRAQARLQQKDKNKYSWHLISILPIKNDKDAVINWIGFFVDIHAQKLVEETLKDNKDLKEAQVRLQEYQMQLETKIGQLNASNHDLEQFAYIASHDLQEPLRKINTFISVLSKTMDLEGKHRNYFDKISSSATRMSLLIKDVLNYSQISNDQIDFVAVDLNVILQEVLAELDLVILEKQSAITSQLLPVIQGVPLQMRQLFSNLLSNSIKFSDGPARIDITVNELDSDQLDPELRNVSGSSYFCIVVKDNGIGFEQQYARQVFNIFQRLNDKQAYTGTGIGLAICKKIIDNHRGFLEAKSEPGKGARFFIYLPIMGG